MSNDTSTFRLSAQINLGVSDREDVDIDDVTLSKALRRGLSVLGLADRTLTVSVMEEDGTEREVEVHFEVPSTEPWEG